MEKTKETTNVAIPSDVYADLRAYCVRRRLIMTSITGDLVRWFLKQPDTLKSAVVGDVDEGMERAYADILERLAHKLRVKAAGGIEEDEFDPNATPRQPAAPPEEDGKDNSREPRRAGRGRPRPAPNH